MSKRIPISIEKFAAYLDNNLPPEEMAQIDNAISANETLQEMIRMNDDIDIYSIENDIEIPEDILTGKFEIPDVDHYMTDALRQTFDSLDEIFYHDGDNSMDNFDTLSHE